MSEIKIVRLIAGYIIGIGFFVGVIPALIYSISRFFFWEISSTPIIQFVIAGLVLIWGFIFVTWSNISLLIKGKGGPTEGFGVAVSPKTKHLVIKGPYRFTRNPMVFGMLSVYYSFVLYLNSLTGLVFVFIVTIIAVIYLKTSEEKRLERDFGEEYLHYKRNVSMIVPLPNSWNGEKNSNTQ